MTRAAGRWVEFRCRDLGGWRNGLNGQLEGLWLYDAEAERWHTGSWPRDFHCYLMAEGNVEPEDCILENPVMGLQFDLSHWADRHWVNACAPDGRWIVVDHRILDLATGDAVRFGAPQGLLDGVPMSDDLPIVGSAEAGSRSGTGEALVHHGGGEFSWVQRLDEFAFDELWDAGIGGVLGRGEHALAWIAHGCIAAAFAPDGRRIAFMTREQVWVVDAANPTGPPLLEYTFERSAEVAQLEHDSLPF